MEVKACKNVFPRKVKVTVFAALLIKNLDTVHTVVTVHAREEAVFISLDGGGNRSVQREGHARHIGE